MAVRAVRVGCRGGDKVARSGPYTPFFFFHAQARGPHPPLTFYFFIRRACSTHAPRPRPPHTHAPTHVHP